IPVMCEVYWATARKPPALMAPATKASRMPRRRFELAERRAPIRRLAGWKNIDPTSPDETKDASISRRRPAGISVIGWPDVAPFRRPATGTEARPERPD